jgi:hypothetical protein
MRDLIGLPIKLERTIDGPCAACGDAAVVIGCGAEPNSASLRCASCDRHRGWLPAAIAEFLTNLVARFGPPTHPIIFRNSELAASLGALAAEASTAPTNR